LSFPSHLDPRFTFLAANFANQSISSRLGLHSFDAIPAPTKAGVFRFSFVANGRICSPIKSHGTLVHYRKYHDHCIISAPFSFFGVPIVLSEHNVATILSVPHSPDRVANLPGLPRPHLHSVAVPVARWPLGRTPWATWAATFGP
jgi:hypothetical protein